MPYVSRPGALPAERAPQRPSRHARPPRPRTDADSLVDGSLPAGSHESDEAALLGAPSAIEAATEAAALDAMLVGSAAAVSAPNASPADSLVATPADTLAGSGGDASGMLAGSRPRRVLAERERAMLTFERMWWRHAGAKEQAIRETFDLSSTHYYRLLNALLDTPAAAEFEPLVVGRLRRLRASRARRRAGR